MANEISLSLSLNVQNPAGSTTGYVNRTQFSKQYNQNALGADSRIVSVPTGGATYTFTVTTPGMMLLQNLDSTNYVSYGMQQTGTNYLPFKIEAGEIALIRLVPGITFAMQANAAAVNISYLLLND